MKTRGVIFFKPLFWATLLFFTLTCNSKERIKVESATPLPSAAPQKWALLVAVDQYAHAAQMAGFLNLSGCVNDALDLKNTLLTRFQFPEDHIVTLFNSAATRDKIFSTFKQHLIEQAKPGDVVMFYFSGHGSQLKDKDGDEPDEYDETLVPHDSRDRDGKVFDITDDEINGLLTRLAAKTRNITFVFDACHSGTGTRGYGVDRRIPADPRTPPQSAEEFAVHDRGLLEGGSGLRTGNLEYVLIAACLQGETAKEIPMNGKWRGALTYYLVQELNKNAGRSTYGDIMAPIKGNVKREVGNQTPQLEGSNQDQYVFTDSSIVTPPHLLLRKSGAVYRLKAGQVEGLTKGSIFAVYPPGTRDFSASVTPTARVEITTVSDTEAEVKIIEGSAPADHSRAVEIEHNYADAQFPVHIDVQNTSAVMRQIEDELRAVKFVKIVPQRSEARLAVTQKNGQFNLEGPDPAIIRSSVPVSATDAVFQVALKVKTWARWHNLLALENKTRPFNVAVSVRPTGTTPAPVHAEGTVLAVKHGQEMEFKVENKSNQTLYFLLLDFSSDGSISAIQSVEGAAERIAANSSWKITWPVGVPDDKTEVEDHIKLIASVHPIDATAIEQAAIKAVTEYSALDQLLANNANGLTRNVLTTGTGNWATAVTSFKVVRP